jgi:hypothetical protein
VKAAAEVAARGDEAILNVKTYSGLYPKAFIEEKLKGMPGGVHIILKGKHPNGKKLFAIGYRYSTRKTLCFVITDGAGSTTPGRPYEMKWTDDYGPVHIREVAHPQVISEYFSKSNSIDTHNQLRQFELALGNKWVTKDPYFRIMTTIFGFNNTDTYFLASYHGLLGTYQYKPTVVEFTGELSYQFLHYFDKGDLTS